MPDKKPRLTPAVRARIVAAIHAGGYPHVAAQAHGIGAELFDSWIKRGSEKGARDPYAAFAREVRQARAEARLLAECNVFKSDPKVWLEHGPGREAPDNPGWSSPVKPSETVPETQSLVSDQQIMELFRAALAAL